MRSWNACRREQGRLDVLPLDPGGRLRLADIASRIGPATRLVCVPHAANETGVIHDIAAISALCERRGVACHVDGTQALGHIPVDLSSLVPHLAAQAGTLRALAGTTLGILRAASCPFEVNGDSDTGLPGLLSLSFPGLNGHTLAADLSIQGFAVATGSACSEDRPEPSRAILALGRPPATALGTIRISFGPGNTPSDAAAVAAALLSAVHRHQPQERR